METKVAIIGAGPSGITALKNLMDKGIEATLFEANTRVGGNWIFSEKASHSSVFETTHIISSKTLSTYADYTWEDHGVKVPDYPSHEQLAHYFEGYARHFLLYPNIQFNTRVLHAELIDKHQWKLSLEKRAPNL